MKSIYFYTLGCSKNTVDSQMMKDSLIGSEYKVTNDIESANYVVVNTCAFIQSAKEESIEAILEIAKLKTFGKLKKLVIAGCLAERYSEELLKEVPEADAILGTGAIGNILELLKNLELKDKAVLKKDINSELPKIPRVGSVKAVEYVKISEGCNNNCSYCIIPKLRGRNRSRKIDDIQNEVRFLVENGTREVILISQNTTDYGIDMGETLSELLRKIDEIEGDYWIRLLYLYLDGVDLELLEVIKNSKHILPYFDIPMQHISNSVLKRMNRNTTRSEVEKTLNEIRALLPDAIIRTTFIVGFPQETEKEFQELLDFITVQKFHKLGVFTYSREENTRAYSMKGQLSEKKKENRRDILMQTQAEISRELLSKSIGREYRVLLEEKAEGEYFARTWEDAPEVDGEVWIYSDKSLSVGEFLKVKITDTMEYDRTAEVLK